MADITNYIKSIFTIYSGKRADGSNNGLSVRIAIAFVVILALAILFSRIKYPWDWSVPIRYRYLFITGFYYTIAISVGSIILGFMLGVLGGLGRIASNVFIREIATFYVEFFRGTPLLVQIYIFYFCVAEVVHFDSPFWVGIVTLGFFSGAYISEMVRAGIESVEKGQIEAAQSLGLTEWQILRLVVFPQALRRIIPPVTGQFVSLIKDSSLLSVISVRELTKASEVINATTYKTFEAYLPLAFLYLILTYPLSRFTQSLEEKLKINS